jgi:hypothetical protein
MLKHLLSFAAIAAVSFSASADLNILGNFGGSGWSSSYDATTKTITYDEAYAGRGWWLDGADYSEYESLVIEFAEPLKATLTLRAEYNGDVSDGSTAATAGETTLEYVLDAAGKSSIKQIYLQYATTGDVVLKSAVLKEPVSEDAFTTYTLNLSGNNLLLSEFKDFADDDEIDVILSISNADSSVAAGWGVGAIHPISDYSTSLYNFSAKAVSAEGEDNVYKFTISEFKKFAQDENGDYITDKWDQQGVTFNVYNGATVKAVQVKVANNSSSAVNSIAVDAEDAPVEYFNLQGIRVANPQNGLFIKRQGNKATKVLVK